MNNWTRRQIFGLIAVVVIATFSAVLRFGFLEHDDDQNIVKNPDLQALSAEQLVSFWERPHLGLYIPVTYTYWAGGVAISRLFQDPLTPAAPSPILFHGANMVLHLLNGILLWYVLGALGAPAIPALFGTLLFLLHPMQVEAVAWITGAKDLLSGCLALAGTLLFLRFLQRDSVKVKKHKRKPAAWPYYFAAIGVSILAILAKPSAVALPLVFFVFSMIYNKRSILQKVFMMTPLLVVVFMVVKMTAGAQVAEGPLPVLEFWQRPFVAGDTVLFYLRQIILPLCYVSVVIPFVVFFSKKRSNMWVALVSGGVAAVVFLLATVTIGPDGLGFHAQFWQPVGAAIPLYLKIASGLPYGFAVDYARRPDLVVANPWLCALAVTPLPIAGLFWRFRKRWPSLFPGFVIFVLLLAPNLGFISFAYQFLSTVCDRYAYLAMAVPAFFVTKITPESVSAVLAKVRGLLAPALKATKEAAQGAAVATTQVSWHALSLSFGAVLLILGALSHQQVTYWTNERSLFQHSVDVEPNGVLAMVGLGNDAANALKWEDSIKYFSTALGMRPDWGRVHNNLGNSYLNVNRLVEATDELKKAIALFPAYPLAFNNLCGCLARREMWDEASAACWNALRLAPDFYMSYQNLGYIAAKRYDYAKAEEFFRAAIRIAPTDVPPRVNLVRVLKLQEQWEKAATELAVLTRMRPRDFGLQMDLAGCYQKLGRIDQARQVYSSIQLDPADQQANAVLHAAIDSLNTYR